MKQFRRLASVAAVFVIGVVGSLSLASPASARDGNTHTISADVDYHCQPDGTRLVAWMILNEQPGQTATVTAISVGPAGTTISLPVGTIIPGGVSKVGFQEVPAGATSAHLDVSVSWPNGEETPFTASLSEDVTFEGTCTPAYTVTQDCTSITFTFAAVDDGGEFPPDPIGVSLDPSVGDTQSFELKGGDPEKKVTFPGSPGLTVDLIYGGLPFAKTYTWTADPCPVPDLPRTGSSLTGPAVIGGGLLLVGIVLVAGSVLFRRRRAVTGA